MSKSIPGGWHTITPRLVVRDAAQLVDFLKQVFGAAGEFEDERPSVIRIGDSFIMISTAGPREAMTSFLYVYVDDVDETERLALKAGAKSLEEAWDTPYGDRRCMIQDPWGNIWQIATAKATGDG